ncbi:MULTISPECIES: amino acid ABC transporter permease [unclassified Brenneria]|uniref:amino acid ABC transporter permease n=1 Tax=unclassified Brenneria TaxID=2634434 RepID=UPI0015539A92|nr:MULTISPECIES: amino acid ABC transporter permease [unclassified Brenneria]MBJ7223953.1 amino acid ABC transporter permease [Brenneria sp. L3-3C-1]MEE3645197.1 amino acid ABC transporter permease [Brenneria sp. L3_3C_1]MEE3649920.1 amino acid ABC transporter permease [Brenneria sp. HEZEL_4_2_4]NPC99878.1 amino acid ABC transporter permease [Brenneria sp. hezel4-2-4]
MILELQFEDVFAAWRMFLDGILVTLTLSSASFIGGLAVGILGAAGCVYGPVWLQRCITGYVEVIRNTPLLVQLFLIFFGLPQIGIRFDGMTAAIIAFIVNLGAYLTEIMRAGFQSVPEENIEAGASLGLSGFQIFRHIVLFPALKNMVPALASQFIFFILATAVVSQIAVPDLFYVGSLVQSRTFRDFEIYILIAALYLSLSLILRIVFSLTYRFTFGRRT